MACDLLVKSGKRQLYLFEPKYSFELFPVGPLGLPFFFLFTIQKRDMWVTAQAATKLRAAAASAAATPPPLLLLLRAAAAIGADAADTCGSAAVAAQPSSRRLPPQPKEQPPLSTSLLFSCGISQCNASRSMSGRVRGAAAKRQRLQLEEEGAAEPAALETTARPMVPLPLLCVVMWFHGTLVWLQLCNPQGVTLFSFVRFPPHVPRPFASAPVYDTMLPHVERLRVVGCGLKGKLVWLLWLGVGLHFEPQRNWGACRKMMQSIARRVAAGLAAAVPERAAKEAERLLAAGQYADAAAHCPNAHSSSPSFAASSRTAAIGLEATRRTQLCIMPWQARQLLCGST